jgi:hypothetical protein
MVKKYPEKAGPPQPKPGKRLISASFEVRRKARGRFAARVAIAAAYFAFS